MNKTEVMTADDFQAKVKKMRPKGEPEHDMQCEIVFDFDKDHPDYEGLLFAVPNGAKLPFKNVVIKGKKVRVSPEAMKLKREGLRSGVPDLCLPVPRGEWHGMFVELKVLPNQPTPEQRYWMDRLTKLGYYCQVVYTRQQGKELFANYLSIQP